MALCHNRLMEFVTAALSPPRYFRKRWSVMTHFPPWNLAMPWAAMKRSIGSKDPSE
jgi:hypothetical protein